MLPAGHMGVARADSLESSDLEASLAGARPRRVATASLPLALALAVAAALAVVAAVGHKGVAQGSTQALRSAVSLSSKHGKIRHESPQNGSSPKEPSCAHIPHVELTGLVQNNLAGAGPDQGEEGIWYSAVDQESQRQILLVLNAIGDYTPQASWENGLSDNMQFATINLKPDSSVNVSFRILDAETKEEVVLPSMFLTFFDLDTGRDGETAEYVSTKIKHVPVHAMLSPLSEVERKDTKDGLEMFWGTRFGTGEDNPDDPHNLTQHQRARTVTLLYENFTSASVTLGATAGELPRYFYFAASPVTRCANIRNVNETFEDAVMARTIAEAKARKAAEEAAKKNASEEAADKASLEAADDAADQQTEKASVAEAHEETECCLFSMCSHSAQWWTWSGCHKATA